MEKLKIGYIGLGLMGGAMAMNILKAGYPLTVWNRTKAKSAQLIAAGATLTASPAKVAEASDIVFTNLSDSPDVLEVDLGTNGVIHGAHPGMILVDNSTIKASASREIYDRMQAVGVSSLDAPVSGGTLW
jgi:3-hydroxyisobutyrate dehydrogenase-like beta-hydroxyacid dehydrogenase